MNKTTFDPFADDETAPAAAAEPATPAAPPAGHDPFAAANAPAAPAPAAAEPETPVLARYTVVKHAINGFGLVLSAGQVAGRNAVVVGWFASVSGPLSTDQLKPVSSS
jgi:hypothetical protein